MRRGKKPTRKQKIRLGQAGLAPENWLAWLVTGEPPKEKGPSDEQTAPGDAPTYYRPPAQAIQEAAERVREGRLEYAAEALTRRSGSEGSRQP